MFPTRPAAFPWDRGPHCVFCPYRTVLYAPKAFGPRILRPQPTSPSLFAPCLRSKLEVNLAKIVYEVRTTHPTNLKVRYFADQNGMARGAQRDASSWLEGRAIGDIRDAY